MSNDAIKGDKEKKEPTEARERIKASEKTEAMNPWNEPRLMLRQVRGMSRRSSTRWRHSWRLFRNG